MADIRAVLKLVTRVFDLNGWSDHEDAALISSRILTEGKLTLATSKRIPDNFFTFNAVSRAKVIEALNEIDTYQDDKAEGVAKVLVLTASPEHAQNIRVDKEMRQIIKRVRSAVHRDQLSIDLLPATEPGDIIDEINTNRPRILQISSHGDTGGVLLDGDDASEGALTGDQLLRIVTHSESVKVVVLNACHSYQQAKNLTSVVDIAIGMSQSIGDDAAIDFSGQFYSSLASGVSIKAAYEQALINVDFKNPADTSVPVLYSAKGVDPARYFIT